MPHEGTDYPRGGLGREAGGDGIFLDPSGEPIRLWLDTRIRGTRAIIKAAEEEGAEISADYDEPETQLLILHPSSFRLFDGLCHPAWLPPRAKKQHEMQRAEGIETQEEWKRKVMVKESWVERCLKAGRFLGEADDWAGSRVGGPPVVKTDPADEEENVEVVAANNLQAEVVLDVVMDSDPAATAQDAGTANQDQAAIAAQMADDAVTTVPSNEPAELMPEDSHITITALPTEPIETDEPVEPVPEPPQDRSPSPSGNRKKRKRSTEAIEIDPALLDTGPSSRFVSPPAMVAPAPAPPPDDKIFRGLAFYVDVSTKNRTEILRDIKSAGGTIAVDYPDATHVLVQRYLANRDKWDALVATYAPRGVWFVYVEWIRQSISGKQRRPESAHCIPGAEQAAAIAPSAATPIASAERNAEAGPSTRPTDSTQPETGAELSVEEIDTIITQESGTMAKQGLRVARLKGEYLAKKHRVYTAKQWKRIYRDWAARTDRFSGLPPKEAATAFETLEQAPLIVKAETPRASVSPSRPARRTKEELDELFEKEAWRFESEGSQGLASYLAQTYGTYTPGTWMIYFTNWRNARKSPPASQARLRSSTARSSHATPPVAPSPKPPPDLPRTGKQPIMTNSKMASIYHKLYTTPKTAHMTNGDVGYHLHMKYPEYSVYTWENTAPAWKHGNGRFVAHGPRWDGRDPSSENRSESVGQESDGDSAMSEKHEEDDDDPFPPPVNAVPSSTPLRIPYTEEEFLAMGQFVASLREKGEQALSFRQWEPFAAVYGHRTYGAWAQQYSTRREKIDQIADRHLASGSGTGTGTEVAETPIEATASASASQTPSVSVKREDALSTRSGSATSPVPGRDKGKGKKGKKRTPVSKQDYEHLARFIARNVADGDVPTTADFDKFSADHPHRKSAGWYSVWHRDKYRSTLLPLIDRYRKEATTATSSSNSKKKPNAYTEEEERAMAEFIVRSVPSDRSPKASDWMLFQKKHTNRSAPAWTEHYRVYTDRIEAFVTEIRGSAASQAGRRAPEVIELGSDEEEG